MESKNDLHMLNYSEFIQVCHHPPFVEGLVTGAAASSDCYSHIAVAQTFIPFSIALRLI